jgi:hypothetical protein
VVKRDGETLKLKTKLDSHPGSVVFDVEDGDGAFSIASEMFGDLQGLSSLESLKGLPFFSVGGGGDGETSATFAWPDFNFEAPLRGKPRLGVVLEDLSPQLASYFKVDEGQGMLITEVIEGSVAERAGLEAGDVLIRIDDVEIARLVDVRDGLQKVESGETAVIEVMRHGRAETFQALLDSEPRKSSDLNLNWNWNGGDTPTLFPDLEAMDGSAEAVKRALEAAAGVKAERQSTAALMEALERSREATELMRTRGEGVAERLAKAAERKRAEIRDGEGAARTF